MKKKIIIPICIIIIIGIIIGVFFLIYNNHHNKLKRYLKNNGYTCNSSICSKQEKNINYQINYKNGTYSYEDDEIKINITKDKTTLEQTNKTSSPCHYTKGTVNKLTTFTTDDTSNNCTNFLEKVNREVENFHNILIKSSTEISKLSK